MLPGCNNRVEREFAGMALCPGWLPDGTAEVENGMLDIPRNYNSVVMLNAWVDLRCLYKLDVRRAARADTKGSADVQFDA